MRRNEKAVGGDAVPFIRASEGPQSLKLGGLGADGVRSLKPGRNSGFVALGGLGACF